MRAARTRIVLQSAIVDVFQQCCTHNYVGRGQQQGHTLICEGSLHVDLLCKEIQDLMSVKTAIAVPHAWSQKELPSARYCSRSALLSRPSRAAPSSCWTAAASVPGPCSSVAAWRPNTCPRL